MMLACSRCLFCRRSAASPPRAVRWAKGDPVMKLTALKDIAASSSSLLKVLEWRRKGTAPLRDEAARAMAANQSEAEPAAKSAIAVSGGGIAGVLHEGLRPKGDGVWEVVDGPFPSASELEFLTPAVCHSALASLHRWTYTLGVVQDWVVRGRLPHAEVLREGAAHVAVVYPLRNVERLVDWKLQCSLQLLTDFVTQTPLPLIHDSTLDPSLRVAPPKRGSVDHEGLGAASSVRRLAPSKKPRTIAKLEAMKRREQRERQLAGSEGSKQQQDVLLQDMAPPMAGGLSPYSKTSFPTFITGGDTAGAASSALSPVALPNYQRLCQTEHGGIIAAEGIHIDLDLEADIRSDVDIRDRLVLTHAAVLSALYINGHAVAFSTTSSLLAFYVRAVFAPLVAERMVTVTLLDEARASPDAHTPYVSPTDDLKHVWFVCTAVSGAGAETGRAKEGGVMWPARELRVVAQYIAEHVPRTVVVDRSWVGAGPLREAVEHCLAARFGADAASRAIEWTDVAEVVEKDPSRAGASCGRDVDFLRSVGQALGAGMVTVMTSSAIQRSHRFRRFIADDISNARVVGVNCSAWDAVAVLPQSISVLLRANRRSGSGSGCEPSPHARRRVPFIGGCYRLESAGRNVVERPLGVVPCVPQWVHDGGHFNGFGGGIAVADMRFLALPPNPAGPPCGGERAGAAVATACDRTFLVKVVDPEKCRGLMTLERALAFLCDPRPQTLIPFMSAKLLGL